MQKQARKRRRRKVFYKTILGSGFILCTLCFTFSDQIVRWSVCEGIAFVFPSAQGSIATACFEKGGISVAHLKVVTPQGTLDIPSASLQLTWSTSPFRLFPAIETKQPTITLKAFPRQLSGHLLFSSRVCKPSISLSEGTLITNEQKIPFSYRSTNGKKGELSSLAPLFFCTWEKGHKKLRVELKLEQMPLAPISFILQSHLPEFFSKATLTEGTVDFAGRAVVSSSLSDLSLKGEGSVSSLKATDFAYGMNISIDSGSFTLDLPKKREDASFDVCCVGGRLIADDPFGQGLWEVSHLNAFLSRRDRGSVHAELQGLIFREEGGVYCGVKGEVLAKDCWSADVRFDDPKTASVKLNCDQNSLSIDFKECDALLVDMGQEVLSKRIPGLLDWEVTGGIVNGRLAFKQGGDVCLSKFLGRDLRIQNFSRQWICAVKQCTAEGVLSSESEIAQLRVSLGGLDADLIQDDGDIWNLTNLGGTFAMHGGKIIESKIQGSFLGLMGELHLQGPSLMSHTLFQLEGGVDQIASLFSQELAEAYNEMEDVPVRIEGVIKESAHISQVVADLFVGKKWRRSLHVEGHVKSGALERVEFSSKRLPHAIYAPVVGSLFSSLEMGGELDLFGSCEGDELECSLIARGALFKHAAYPLTFVSSQDEVKASLKGNLGKESWHIDFAPFKGSLKDSKPFAFDFEMTLSLTKEQGSDWHCVAQLREGHLKCGTIFNATDLSFEAEFDEKSRDLICHNLQTTTISTRPLAITAERFHFAKQGDKWAWGSFVAHEEGKNSFKGKIEALSNQRNPHSFLLLFQKENLSPYFFQGKTENNVWNLESLPEESRKTD